MGYLGIDISTEEVIIVGLFIAWVWAINVKSEK